MKCNSFMSKALLFCFFPIIRRVIHMKCNSFMSKAGESRMLSANIIRWHFEEWHCFYCVCFSVCPSCVVANADGTLRAVIVSIVSLVSVLLYVCLV